MDTLASMKEFLREDFVYAALALAIGAIVILYRQVQSLQEKRIEQAREVIALSSSLVRVIEEIQKK